MHRAPGNLIQHRPSIDGYHLGRLRWNSAKVQFEASVRVNAEGINAREQA
jgi:hypothetical protein